MHHWGPVRMVQALEGTLEALREQAARFRKKNKTTPTVADSHGALQAVADEGGRHTMRSMVLDVQSAARSFDERTQVVLETAQAGADTWRVVDPQSLSVPTQRPLSSFDSRSYPACYAKFWREQRTPAGARGCSKQQAGCAAQKTAERSAGTAGGSKRGRSAGYCRVYRRGRSKRQGCCRRRRQAYHAQHGSRCAECRSFVR